MHDYYKEHYNTKTEEYIAGLEQVAERSKINMYNNTLDGVSAYIWQQVHNPRIQSIDQHDVDAENCTQLPYHACCNDILIEYPAWSTDTNDIENTNKAQYRENRQDILNAWQTDTPVKMPDNRQVLDNIEAYTQDRFHITQSLNHRLGLRKSSLPRTQPVTVATMQSNQLTTNIPNHLSNSIATDHQKTLAIRTIGKRNYIR